jgi:cobalt-zinc-cadmium efflux system outer membrane protein
MRRGHAALLAMLSTLAAGCVSSSIAADVRNVRELAKVEALPRVADQDVDPAADEAQRRILAEPLDADAAVRAALLGNRELRAALREMGVARGQLQQAGLLPNPLVEVELLPERNSHVELRVEYDVTGLLLAPLRARAAAPELEAARYRAAGAVVALGYRVRAAFYRVQAAEQRLLIAQQALDAWAAGRDAARALGRAGNVAELDVATQEAAYERARVAVAQIELDVLAERERLQRLLGTWGTDTAWRVRGELAPVPAEPPPAEHLETRALRANLDLRELRERLESLARRAGFARAAGWIPDVTVDVHALYGNPEAAAGLGAQEELRFGGGVAATVPIFDRKQGMANALGAQAEALLERYQGLAVDVRSAARETRGRVASAYARARQYEDVIVPAQRRVTEQTLLQYGAMQIGVFQLLQARREQLDVEMARIETLREYWTAVAELGALLGGKLVQAESRGASAMPGAAAPGGGH